ncbi:MAG: hypothetical protein ACHQFX_14575 [Chitinophagales bacterium]
MPTQEASIIWLHFDIDKTDASFLSVTKGFIMPTQGASIIWSQFDTNTLSFSGSFS